MLIDKIDPQRGFRAAGKTSGADIVHEEFLLARTNAFEIGNVEDLCRRTGWLKGDHEVDLSKFPNVAPPFRSYWMEWTEHDHEFGRLGCWCVVTDDTDDEQWTVAVGVWAGGSRVRPVGRALISAPRDGSPLTEIQPLTCYPEVGRRRSSTSQGDDTPFTVEQTARMARIQALPDKAERMRLLTELSDEYRASAAESEKEILRLDSKILRMFVYPPLLMAHSLLACKNVSTEVHPVQPRVAKAHRRRHGRDKVTFRTLVVNPTGGGRHEPLGQEDTGDGVKALHIVRGHFKTFTADRPLFGSRVGTWWWSPTARGDEEAGVVVKDYRVNVP